MLLVVCESVYVISLSLSHTRTDPVDRYILECSSHPGAPHIAFVVNTKLGLPSCVLREKMSTAIINANWHCTQFAVGLGHDVFIIKRGPAHVITKGNAMSAGSP